MTWAPLKISFGCVSTLPFFVQIKSVLLKLLFHLSPLSGRCFPLQTGLRAHGLDSSWFKLNQRAGFRYALNGL